MKKIVKIFMGVLFVAILLGTFVFLWNKTRPVKVVYQVVSPTFDTIRQEVVAMGKIEPRDEVLIKPQIAGIISEIHKEEGQMVKRGEVIATVKVIPDMSSLSNAESRLNVSRINLNQVKTEYARNMELHKKGVISAEEFEKSQTALKTAQEEFQMAKDNLEIVQSGVSKRNAGLGNTQIRSTIDGMILSIPIKVGNSVIQSNSFNDGTTIATIANMGDMLFVGNVDETDIGKLTKGMKAKVSIGAMQNVTLEGVLEYISPKSKDQNGVVMFEVKIATQVPADVFVRSGYSANAVIVISSREGILTIPESCVEFSGDKNFVYILKDSTNLKEQTFDRREIKTGYSDGLKIEVVEGVKAGQKLRANRAKF